MDGRTRKRERVPRTADAPVEKHLLLIFPPRPCFTCKSKAGMIVFRSLLESRLLTSFESVRSHVIIWL